MIKKNPKADLRSYHTLFVQLGIICSLLFIIAATKASIDPTKKNKFTSPTIVDPPAIIDIPITHTPKIPVYIAPPVFIEVPPEVIIDDPIMEFPDFDIGESITPPPIKKKKEEEIFNPHGVQFLPQLKGGLPTLYKEIQYPEVARRAGIEGRVQVQFVVNKEGKVENPKILRGIGGGCDEEVLRVIKLMSFTPGIQNGQFVKVRMSQSVNFKLQN